MSEEDSYNAEREEKFEDVFEALIATQTEPYMESVNQGENTEDTKVESSPEERNSDEVFQ